MLIVNNIAQFLQTSIKQTPSIKHTWEGLKGVRL